MRNPGQWRQLNCSALADEPGREKLRFHQMLVSPIRQAALLRFTNLAISGK
jgi:hypothetical protein